MRIEPAALQGSAESLSDRSAAPADVSDAVSTSRALVPTQVDTSTRWIARAGYTDATFLAHLIAVERRLPQMRTRGRCAPADAAAVYGATLVGAPGPLGSRLRRSV